MSPGYRSYAFTKKDTEGLAEDIAAIRHDAYYQRLAELGDVIGQKPRPLAPDIAARIARQAAAVAKGVTRTHNRDLRRAVDRRIDNLRAWSTNRADWKSTQVAYTETQRARAQADADFRKRNGLQVGGRVVPEDAQCEECQALVDAGEMTADELNAVVVPVHPNCIHEIFYSADLADVAGDEIAWLGDDLEGGPLQFVPKQEE